MILISDLVRQNKIASFVIAGFAISAIVWCFCLNNCTIVVVRVGQPTLAVSSPVGGHLFEANPIEQLSSTYICFKALTDIQSTIPTTISPNRDLYKLSREFAKKLIVESKTDKHGVRLAILRLDGRTDFNARLLSSIIKNYSIQTIKDPDQRPVRLITVVKGPYFTQCVRF